MAGEQDQEVGVDRLPTWNDDDLTSRRDESSDALYDALIAGLIACVTFLALLCVLRMVGIL